MSSYNRLFSIETAAWPASAVTISTVRREKGMTCAATASGVDSSALESRFRLMSCSAPMISLLWFFIGTVSMDFDRYLLRSSMLRLNEYSTSGGRKYTSSITSGSPVEQT